MNGLEGAGRLGCTVQWDASTPGFAGGGGARLWQCAKPTLTRKLMILRNAQSCTRGHT